MLKEKDWIGETQWGKTRAPTKTGKCVKDR